MHTCRLAQIAKIGDVINANKNVGVAQRRKSLDISALEVDFLSTVNNGGKVRASSVAAETQDAMCEAMLKVRVRVRERKVNETEAKSNRAAIVGFHDDDAVLADGADHSSRLPDHRLIRQPHTHTLDKTP